ncbi:MAG: hypothetical protein JWP87_2200 [Labilithrix sp.]|jgi:hypothetical protein|nr:hypothetical protein [Labilithrix sp.]
MRKRARAVFAVAASMLVVSCAALVDLEEVPYAAGDAATADHRDAAPIEPALDAGAAGKGVADATAGDASACEVRADTKLHCTNRVNAPLHTLPKESATVVNTLRTTTSYFLCWGTGELHAGGNTTWYYTQGDDNPNLGWTPGVMLNTPDAFDANPTAFGLRNCAQ